MGGSKWLASQTALIRCIWRPNEQLTNQPGLIYEPVLGALGLRRGEVHAGGVQTAGGQAACLPARQA